MNFVIADEILADVERWLEEAVRAAEHQDSIEYARVFEPGADAYPIHDGHTVRTCQFQARDDNSLDELLDDYFSNIEAEAADKYDAQVVIDSRILRADHSMDVSANESPVCRNCGTRLRGQYCAACGQRSRNRLISIWQLLQEAFGDLLELDSRLWRTLVPLLMKPGQLTKDYLEGRRARYMPPFRTYLVLSVIFFVVAFFNPQEDLSLFYEPEPAPAVEEIATQAKAAMAAAEENDSNLFDNCDEASIADKEDIPEWFRKRFTDDRIQRICENNKARGIDNFGDAILDNIPVALFVLLPLMALVLKILYPLSRRYFVEHLLFFVHFHAFFFLMLILQVLFARVAGLLGSEDGAIDSIATLILVVASFYVPVYLYKAMRHVYGQGHLVTISKYLLLLLAYVAGAALTMFGAFLVALLTA